MSHDGDSDVIVIGAGIAGLAAARELACAGRSIVVLEARDRIGGRIHYVHDAACNVEIPLGAEFIHGKPEEIWTPLQHAGVGITEIAGTNWCVSEGRLNACDFFSEVETLLAKMDDQLPDESFADFLQRFPVNDAAERRTHQRALRYVAGFNAAEPSCAGVHWLVQQQREEERNEGDRAFRIDGGYRKLLDIFSDDVLRFGQTTRTSTTVNRINWKPGHVEVDVTDTHGCSTLRAGRIVITLPLGVLKSDASQPGAVQFTPPLPQSKLDALKRLEMGKVIRVTLRFRERFWESLATPDKRRRTLSDMGFLFTEDEWFPTWWTTMPHRLPIITGWAPVHSAERLSGQEREFVIQHSLESLGSSLRVSTEKLCGLLEASYFHDWQSDPFSRGAYSYGAVGSDGAHETLADPVDETLFFAGEHTDLCGNNGTVHGAIASGYRAAKQIIINWSPPPAIDSH